MMLRIRKTERAFTLLELLVVIAILLIIMAITVPNFMRALRRYQLESSARNVANMLVRARYEAIRSNRNVTTILQVGNPTVYGLDLDAQDADADGSNLDINEPRIGLSARVPMMGPGGAPALGTMGPIYAGSQPPPVAFQVTFSPRGTSMRPVAGPPPVFIEASNIYVLYLQHQADNTWAAVTVTPGGRVRVWFFSGNAWVS